MSSLLFHGRWGRMDLKPIRGQVIYFEGLGIYEDTEMWEMDIWTRN